ncbi:uncharacterized protein PHALS_06619 [Plasmopara halstedii]|uniref:Uncharacterized protein n=1 Tax=Plasmopara halstedii TaxID=4781 RepID=A0A0N7L841_PLAHL|nr:uncharacterized protein PHALS_06619 [Plasmopara halstedii]CEG48819.1 hypothetical protein PHALS_06619 [Plasmopara halstedii]|eukprot:XP_024585188.1 hypothetical protein PHALS_06619 [Plasmopara halstedii]
MNFGFLKAFVIVTFIACTFTSIGANDVVSNDIKTRQSRRLGMFSGIYNFFGMSGDDAAKASAKLAGAGADDVAAQAKTLSTNFMKEMTQLYPDRKSLQRAVKEFTKLPKTKMEKFKKVAKMAGLGIVFALSLYGSYSLSSDLSGPPRTAPQT